MFVFHESGVEREPVTGCFTVKVVEVFNVYQYFQFKIKTKQIITMKRLIFFRLITAMMSLIAVSLRLIYVVIITGEKQTRLVIIYDLVFVSERKKNSEVFESLSALIFGSFETRLDSEESLTADLT